MKTCCDVDSSHENMLPCCNVGGSFQPGLYIGYREAILYRNEHYKIYTVQYFI